jgi:hypothetical protein
MAGGERVMARSAAPAVRSTAERVGDALPTG